MSYNSTSFIKSTTFWMSSLSNYNTNNTKSVILVPSSSALSLKVQSTLKSAIRGILLSKLFWWPISLIPPIRSLASECRARVVTVILLLSEIMPTYSCCVLKGLVYIIIIASLGCQPSFYTKCIKLNMYLFYNICLVSNAKYIFLVHFYTL